MEQHPEQHPPMQQYQGQEQEEERQQSQEHPQHHHLWQTCQQPLSCANEHCENQKDIFLQF